jgi:hypothetical protein
MAHIAPDLAALLGLLCAVPSCGATDGSVARDASVQDARVPDAAGDSVRIDSGADEPAITDGLGTKTGGGTGTCTPTEDRYIDGDFGTITARDGRTFPLPGPLHPGASCTDLYNPCNGGPNPSYESQLQTIVIDDTADAVEVTGTIYGDNYFELYVNGTYVCRDALTFVPFNAHVVRFKARYPMTIALQGVDWEQSLGTGVELRNGANHVGDGGLVAKFVDANGRVVSTSADWKCLPHYVAPVDDPTCVGPGRDSSECPPAACAAGDLGQCHAVLWPVPPNWTSPSFDDTGWPAATRYAVSEVAPKTAYTANAALFEGADFIWSKNLAIDNLVLCRRTLAP